MKLTKREAEVARELAGGLLHKQIAVKLGIGKRTVEKHAENIRTKLGAKSLVNLGYLLAREIREAA